MPHIDVLRWGAPNQNRIAIVNKFTELARLLKKLNTGQTENIPAQVIIEEIEAIIAGSELRLREAL